MNFGRWILVAFVLFAFFIGTLVTVCMREDISLVSKTYYQEELAHQQKIERIQNANALESLPDFAFVDGKLSVTFAQFNKVSDGNVRLVRPSDARLDQAFALRPATGTEQQFTLSAADRGLYRASMQWSMDGKEYYVEKLIVL